MQPTPYPDVNELIKQLLSKIRTILGSKLIGFYLEGSLVLGDFDLKTSDIDTLAVVSNDIDEKEYEAFKKFDFRRIDSYKIKYRPLRNAGA
jgi:predicted nucleotidyltransferase